MSSVLNAKTLGAAAQYQTAATTPGAYNSTNIHPFDSGTILGTVPPGKPGIKQIDGTIQNATALIVDGTSGATGNALNSTASQGPNGPLGVPYSTGVPPTVNAAQLESAGLSLAPQTE
jgi:hypothetical protein